MARLVAIVEGHGEVEAVPILLRRIAAAVRPDATVDVPRPIRVTRDRLLKPGELERAIALAAHQCAEEDGILVLFDADRDCPKSVADEARRRAEAARPHRKVRVVLAKQEFEAWFVAAIASVTGRRGIREDVSAPADPESIRDAKGWLSRSMRDGRSYRETLDQPALAAVFDLEVARRAAPSFDKLWRDVCDLLGAGV